VAAGIAEAAAAQERCGASDPGRNAAIVDDPRGLACHYRPH